MMEGLTVLSAPAGRDEREHNEKPGERHPVLKMDAEKRRLADEPRQSRFLHRYYFKTIFLAGYCN